jgi:hypothetical protein
LGDKTGEKAMLPFGDARKTVKLFTIASIHLDALLCFIFHGRGHNFKLEVSSWSSHYTIEIQMKKEMNLKFMIKKI